MGGRLHRADKIAEVSLSLCSAYPVRNKQKYNVIWLFCVGVQPNRRENHDNVESWWKGEFFSPLTSWHHFDIIVIFCLEDRFPFGRFTPFLAEKRDSRVDSGAPHVCVTSREQSRRPSPTRSTRCSISSDSATPRRTGESASSERRIRALLVTLRVANT